MSISYIDNMWYNFVGDKMNTVIIDKILVHMMDMEHSQLIFSQEFISLEEGTTEYYDKKIEKTISSATKKEIVVGQNHSLFQDSKKMFESKEQFMDGSKKITKELFEIVKQIEMMPNSNLLFVECKIDGRKHLLVMKLNYKMTPVSIIEEVDGQRVVKIVNRQTLPPKTTAVDDAIIVDVESQKLFIIEKRYTIDGKPGCFLNDVYIKGEPKLTDKQKLSLVNKVVQAVDSEFRVVEGSPLPFVKQEVIQLALDHQPIKPLALAKKVVEKDYEATKRVEEIMSDIGIFEEDRIEHFPGNIDKLGRCKLYLDDNTVIELDLDDYLDGRNIEKTMQENGFQTITLSNIKDIIVK